MEELYMEAEADIKKLGNYIMGRWIEGEGDGRSFGCS
jgi:hypothetical protein